MARQDFIVDVALARDRSIAGVFAGHSEKAHRAGVEFVSAKDAAPIAGAFTCSHSSGIIDCSGGTLNPGVARCVTSK